MASIFGFFGDGEHRVFNYRPRYYDEEKEALKEKFGEVDGSKEKGEYVPGSYIKGSFRGGNYRRTKLVTKGQRIIGIIGLLLVFVILILLVRFFSIL